MGLGPRSSHRKPSKETDMSRNPSLAVLGAAVLAAALAPTAARADLVIDFKGLNFDELCTSKIPMPSKNPNCEIRVADGIFFSHTFLSLSSNLTEVESIGATATDGTLSASIDTLKYSFNKVSLSYLSSSSTAITLAGGDPATPSRTFNLLQQPGPTNWLSGSTGEVSFNIARLTIGKLAGGQDITINNIVFYSSNTNPGGSVPEPGAMGLAALALGSLAWIRRRPRPDSLRSNEA